METTANETSEPEEANVREVAKMAEAELHRLNEALAAITKRTQTVRRTLAGMANMFGEQFFSDELLELMGRKGSGRQSGLTSACRQTLLEASEKLSAVDICDRLSKRHPGLLDRHKNPLASITTVMHRLVRYGEAREAKRNSRRAWESVGSSDAGAAELFESEE
jgi:hypothetical protein